MLQNFKSSPLFEAGFFFWDCLTARNLSKILFCRQRFKKRFLIDFHLIFD